MNPFELYSHKPSSSSFLMPILLLFIIMIGFIGSIDTQLLENNNPIFILKDNEKSNYKHVQEPKNGVIRLIKGKCKVIHHSIKEDSVIITSRKSLEGKTGFHLIVDIEPNKYFTIKSISESENGEMIQEEEDCGEVFFTVY